MPPYNPTALDTVSCYGPNGVYTDRLGGTYQRYFYSLHLHHNVSTYQTPVGIYTSWNVTGAVQDWVSGVKPNYGLLLKERDEDQSTQVSYVTFASSEYVHVHNASYLPCPTGEDGQAFPPRLVVDYTLPLSGADIWQTTDIVLDRDIWTRGSQKFPTDNNMRNGLHPTLGDNLMYLHADMSVLPPNAVVDSAQLNLFYYGLGGPSVSVAAFRLTADWVENLSTGIPAHDPTEIDLSQGSGVDADGFAVGMYYFVWDRFYNMTGVVQDWLNGQPNYGVLLQDTPANTTQSKYSYLAHEHPQVNYRPKFTVTWNCGACQSIIDEVSELTCNLPPTTNIAEAQAAVASAIAQAQSDVDYDCTDCVEAFMDQLVLTLLAE